MAFILTSPAFADNGAIPKQYTCEGAGISPPLQWSNAPQGTKSFALIVDDPDAPDPKAPRMTWVHWVVQNIPAGTQALPEDAAQHGMPSGALQGLNGWQRTGYGGPCPPVGKHRYFHKLYALDTVLSGPERPTKEQLMQALHGHILAEAQLIGTYQKTER